MSATLNGKLKDAERHILQILVERSGGPIIVGNIQRELGVLPAQMSRLLRSLENRERALVTCAINPTDKRKVDVSITQAGRQALTRACCPKLISRKLLHLQRELRNLPKPDDEDCLKQAAALLNLLQQKMPLLQIQFNRDLLPGSTTNHP